MLTSQDEIIDFKSRWQKARIAALKSCIPSSLADDESQLLKDVPAEAQDAAVTKVFENSRKFGQSFARHFGMVLELSDFQSILPQLGVTCLSGQWHSRIGSVVREKTGCVEELRLGSFFCDYWREAIDGLTLGASEDILFTRHGSCRHGDERCVDVWFEDKGESSRETAKGPIPDWAQAHLDAIVLKYKEQGVAVKFKGVSEGVLYCQITSKDAPSCKDQGGYKEKISQELRLFWPGVMVKDVTPVAVYGENNK